MFDAARTRLAIARTQSSIGACIVAGLGASALAACTTPQVTPQLSEAVIEARAHRNVAPEGVCPENALNTVSPIMVGFGFGESDVNNEDLALPLTEPARWLACHTATQVVIKPDADSHGADAEQDALARRRAEGVRNYLSTHGVAPARIRILRRNEEVPTGAVFIIRAEGRRW
jgi:outer membrane protein OmpA-like peptidoglycan-associated protein